MEDSKLPAALAPPRGPLFVCVELSRYPEAAPLPFVAVVRRLESASLQSCFVVVVVVVLPAAAAPAAADHRCLLRLFQSICCCCCCCGCSLAIVSNDGELVEIQKDIRSNFLLFLLAPEASIPLVLFTDPHCYRRTLFLECRRLCYAMNYRTVHTL